MYDAQVVLAKGTVAFGFGLHWSWQGSVCQQNPHGFGVRGSREPSRRRCTDRLGSGRHPLFLS